MKRSSGLIYVLLDVSLIPYQVSESAFASCLAR